MAKGGGAAVLGFMLIGVLAVALLFGSQIIGFVSGLPDRIQDWIDSIRGTFPGAGGDVEGQTWIGYTVHYADGTTEEIRESAPSFSIMPFSISLKSGFLSSLTVNLKVQLYGDDLDSWSGDFNLHTELYKTGEATPRTSASANYTKQGSSWVNGAIKTLATYDLSADDLENVAQTYGQGEYTLQFTGHVKLTVTSEGVPIDLSAAAPSGTMTFLYLSYDPPTWFSITGDSTGFGEAN